MSEFAVLNIAKSLLEQLSSPAKDELLLWFNSKNELKKLESTIRSIKDVLHDAERKQATNVAVRGWLSRLQQEMYKADDLFDVISTRALRKKVIPGEKIMKEMRIFFSISNHLVFNITIAHEVKELRGRLDGIAKDINQFGFIRSTIEDERPAIKRNVQSHSYIPEDDVIGREKDKEKILRLLLADTNAEERVSVIAVVGIGGLGKTALVQLVYNAKEIMEFFDLRLWAWVNDFSNLNEALEKITASGLKKTPSGLQLESLQNMLRRRIRGKKFLLVLDHVWDDIREQWLGLKHLLDAGERGSKILITTRLMTVAQNLSTGKHYYALRELSNEHAWLLFKKMAFDSNEEQENQAREALGREIVKKCPKVPLAIRTIVSFLYNKDKKQWSTFVENELMKAMPNPENMIMQALKISYNDLPPSLKYCFAYCSLFPKDYEYNKTTLIHLWMAQGLLETSEENQCLEDVGESYFFYLMKRCFFQNVMVDGDGHVVSCKMHDLFHDLAIEIAEQQCLSSQHLLPREIKDTVRQGKGIRSLVTFHVGFVERGVLDDLFRNLTSLRTLILRHLDIEELPSSIGKLVHLRYFDVMMSEKLIRLPDALCELQNLLTLRLGGCANLNKLPNDLQKLVCLRYLETEGCRKLNHVPLGLKEMTSLVMLDRLIVNKDQGGLRCLKYLNKLTGVIHIELPGDHWKNCVVDAEESMLRSKTKLSRLVISWGRSTGGEEILEADAVLDRLQPPNSIDHLLIDNFPGVKYPDWLSSLENLLELVLKNCSRCLELPYLRQLCQLKRLTLGSIPHLEYVANDSCYNGTSFFPSLEELMIYDMPRLKGWWRPSAEVSDAHQLWFSRLSALRVKDCPELTQLPLYPSVEYLVLDNVSVNLLTQLVRTTPTRFQLKAKNLLLPSSSSNQTCCRIDTIKLKRMKDLAFEPNDFKHLSTLRVLEISNCPSFKRRSLFCSLEHLALLEQLWLTGSDEKDVFSDEKHGKDGMPWMSLTRLKKLGFEFGSDPHGAYLLKGLHHLTKLEYLYINKNVPDNNDMEWTAPPNIQHLKIIGMDNVTCLNRVIQHLESLQFLVIYGCSVDEDELDKLPWESLTGLRRVSFSRIKGMKYLPRKCRHLPALEDLRIIRCLELTSLPGWVSQLTSLEIKHCPTLKEKCRKPVGTYWPLIQAIPYLNICTTSKRDPYFLSSREVMPSSVFCVRTSCNKPSALAAVSEPWIKCV